jgi:hypothetical protein
MVSTAAGPTTASPNTLRSAPDICGSVDGPPVFGLAALRSGARAHTAQPSAGIVFRF